MTDEDSIPNGGTHYFYDSEGHLYVDMTAIRERGRLEFVPLGGGEIEVRVSEVGVDKQNPVLSLSITEATEKRLCDYYENAPSDEAVITRLNEVGDLIGLASKTLEEADRDVGELHDKLE